MDRELLKANLNGLERKLMVLIGEHKSLQEEVKNRLVHYKTFVTG